MKKGWIETPTHPKDPILTITGGVRPGSRPSPQESSYAKTPFRGQDLPEPWDICFEAPENLVAGKLRYCRRTR